MKYSSSVKNILAVLGGVGAGAGLMYLLDPDRGEDRRAAIKEKAVGISNDLRKSVYTTGSELKARASEVIHDATARLPRVGNPQPEKAGSGLTATRSGRQPGIH